MKSSFTYRITATAILLALSVLIRFIGSLPFSLNPIGLIITGSMLCAAMIFASTKIGVLSGLSVCLVCPVFDYVFRIYDSAAAIPIQMAGNILFVLVSGFFFMLMKRVKQTVIVEKVVLVFGVCAATCIRSTLMSAAVRYMIPIMNLSISETIVYDFGTPQLVTGIIGGTAAVIIVSLLQKKEEKQAVQVQ